MGGPPGPGRVGGAGVGWLGRSGVGDGASVQADTAPRIAAAAIHRGNAVMWVILLEALGAGLIFVFIVWWTMFHGRRGGERRDEGSNGADSRR